MTEAALFAADATRCSPGGASRTWAGDDVASLMDDREERVFGTLPDETWTCPGHGDDTALVGSARRSRCGGR